MTTQTYTGITAQKYNQLEAALSEDKDVTQAVLHKTGGSATYRGVSFTWTYVPEACNLVVSIINKRGFARFVDDSYIFQQISQHLLS